MPTLLSEGHGLDLISWPVRLEENKDFNSGLRLNIAGHDPKSGHELELRAEVLIPPMIRLSNVGEAG
ncbi:hypothetical protein NPIL_646351, partial [Nephila pilipes]